jgi:hypothetical protein
LTILKVAPSIPKAIQLTGNPKEVKSFHEFISDLKLEDNPKIPRSLTTIEKDYKTLDAKIKASDFGIRTFGLAKLVLGAFQLSAVVLAALSIASVIAAPVALPALMTALITGAIMGLVYLNQTACGGNDAAVLIAPIIAPFISLKLIIDGTKQLVNGKDNKAIEKEVTKYSASFEELRVFFNTHKESILAKIKETIEALDPKEEPTGELNPFANQGKALSNQKAYEQLCAHIEAICEALNK